MSTDDKVIELSYIYMYLALCRFIEDFCKKENNGLSLLLTLLRNIQKTTKEMTSVLSKERAQNRKRLLV